MATLTPTLTLASTDISADETLNLTVTDTLTVAGGAQTFQKVVSATKSNLLLAANYTKSYVYLQNLDSSIVIHIGMDTEADDTINDDATDLFIELAAGEFAFFPWSATYNLHVDAASGTPTLEVRVYQAAA